MSESLFEKNQKQLEPLASRMRPSSLEEIIGQKKLIGILTRLQKPMSLVLYGSPGTGKTSVARILSDRWKIPFYSLNAVSAGVKEVKDLISQTARIGNIVLFLDEIHRFNSGQQDTLLEAVESGRVILIGATTENPAFRINRALLSRCQIFKLENLQNEDLEILYHNAKEKWGIVSLDKNCIGTIIHASSGDARRFLSILDIIDSMEPPENGWTSSEIESLLESQLLQYDKNKENHYDYISAFIKSIRGSDPDAALFYLACMLEGGEDPIFLFRRLIILASEDVGNASFYGLIVAEAGLSAFEKIGMPEGRIILSQVVTFLASAPKSNASYNAINSAMEFVKREGKEVEIPLHLRNAPTFLHKKELHGQNYKYPHDHQNGFVDEFYFPEKLKISPPQFYFPTDRGMEKTFKERLAFFWEKLGFKSYK
jgi:putative ATPase